MPKLFTLTLLTAFIVLLVSSCISLKKPEANLLAEISAHNTAYLFAKNNPSEANKLIMGPLPRFIDTLTQENAAQVFTTFSATLLALTVEDPMLRTSFESFLALIEFDLKGLHPAQSLFIVNQVLTHFLNGLKLGTIK